jgi:hypothetical protein
MDLRAFLLYLHHSNLFTGLAARTLDPAMTPHYRTVVPGHNSVAWLLWHIARGQDWAFQTILQEQEQLLTRDGWDARMAVNEPGFGGGMERDAMIALTEQINLDGLRGYYHAAAEATQVFLRTFDVDQIERPFEVQARLGLAPAAQGPSPLLYEAFARWTTPLLWVEVFALSDVALHFGEAEHVLNLLASERPII